MSTVEDKDRDRLRDICTNEANLVRSFKHKPWLKDRFRRVGLDDLVQIEELSVTFPSRDLGFKAVYNFDLGCLQIIKLVPLKREIFVPNIGQIRVGMCLTTIRCVDVRFISPDIIATELTRQKRPLRLGFCPPNRLVLQMRMDESATKPGTSRNVYGSASSPKRSKRHIRSDVAAAAGTGNNSIESKVARRGVLDSGVPISENAAKAAKGRIVHGTRTQKLQHHVLQEIFRRDLELKDLIEKVESDVKEVQFWP